MIDQENISKIVTIFLLKLMLKDVWSDQKLSQRRKTEERKEKEATARQVHSGF